MDKEYCIRNVSSGILNIDLKSIDRYSCFSWNTRKKDVIIQNNWIIVWNTRVTSKCRCSRYLSNFSYYKYINNWKGMKLTKDYQNLMQNKTIVTNVERIWCKQICKFYARYKSYKELGVKKIVFEWNTSMKAFILMWSKKICPYRTICWDTAKCINKITITNTTI